MKHSHNQTCFYCNCRVFRRGSPDAIANPKQCATEDHYIPRLFKTMDDRRVMKRSNVVIACSWCNNTKAGFPPEIFEFFLKSHYGTSNFTPAEMQKFCYGLALAGFKAAKAIISAEKHTTPEKPSVPDPVAPKPQGRFTKKDLRRK